MATYLDNASNDSEIASKKSQEDEQIITESGYQTNERDSSIQNPLRTIKWAFNTVTDSVKKRFRPDDNDNEFIDNERQTSNEVDEKYPRSMINDPSHESTPLGIIDKTSPNGILHGKKIFNETPVFDVTTKRPSPQSNSLPYENSNVADNHNELKRDPNQRSEQQNQRLRQLENYDSLPVTRTAGNERYRNDDKESTLAHSQRYELRSPYIPSLRTTNEEYNDNRRKTHVFNQTPESHHSDNAIHSDYNSPRSTYEIDRRNETIKPSTVKTSSEGQTYRHPFISVSTRKDNDYQVLNQRKRSESSPTVRPSLSDNENDDQSDISKIRPTLRREPRLYGEPQFRENGMVLPPTKPCITPDRYDGRTSWKEYYNHFESCAMINRWNDGQKAQFLAASLRGSAQKVLSRLGDITTTHAQYDDLIRLLQQRYGTNGQAEKYLWQLRSRKRRQSESLAELGQSILELTELAYPELDGSAIDRLARQYFTEAIPDQSIRMDLYRERPRSLDECIRSAVSIEAYLQAEAEKSGQRRRIRQVEYDEHPSKSYNTKVHSKNKTTTSIDDVLLAVKELTAQLSNREQKTKSKLTEYPQRNPVECYGCGQKGHIRRNCPQQGNEK